MKPSKTISDTLYQIKRPKWKKHTFGQGKFKETRWDATCVFGQMRITKEDGGVTFTIIIQEYVEEIEIIYDTVEKAMKGAEQWLVKRLSSQLVKVGTSETVAPSADTSSTHQRK